MSVSECKPHKNASNMPDSSGKTISCVLHSGALKNCLPLSVRCEIKINPQEHSEYEWLPIQLAIERVWSWSNKAAIQAITDSLATNPD